MNKIRYAYIYQGQGTRKILVPTFMQCRKYITQSGDAAAYIGLGTRRRGGYYVYTIITSFMAQRWMGAV